MRKRLRAPVAAHRWGVKLLGLLLAAPAHAVVTAHVEFYRIDSGCLVDNHEGPTEGDPERYFRAAFFDLDSPTLLASCADGCSADSKPSTADGATLDYCVASRGCDSYEIPIKSLTKVTRPHAGVWFYLGLYDADSDEDDLLGDHWVYLEGTSSGPVLNNNLSPYKPGASLASACGQALEGSGNAGNFYLEYTAWFEDSTPPDAPPPVHRDDGIATLYDNDEVLSFDWPPPDDPDSGVSETVAYLFDYTTNQLLADAAPTSGNQATICASGCDIAVTPQHGHEYGLAIRTRNGALPELRTPAYTTSAFTRARVDLVPPQSLVLGPPPGSWHGADFAATTEDLDDGSGVASCEAEISDAGVVVQAWAPRPCDGAVAVGVGPGGACTHEGDDICLVRVRAVDAARNVGAAAELAYSVDLTGNAIASVVARTEADGELLPEGVPVSDSTPNMSFAAAPGGAPIAGYSWAWNATADCAPDGGAGSADFALPNGTRIFSVRAIDSAGNCGDPASFTLVVADPAQLFWDDFE